MSSSGTRIVWCTMSPNGTISNVNLFYTDNGTVTGVNHILPQTIITPSLHFKLFVK